MLRKLTVTSTFVAMGILSALYAAPIAGAFGVGVQPSTVEMTVKPGDRQRQVVTIGNVHKTKTISLTMGLADWSLDKEGKLVLDAPGETPRSAAEWIRFSPASVTLKPETSQDVTVEISVPYKLENKGDHRFALLASTMLPELNERGETSGVWNRYQLASLFYLTLTPSESLPKVASVMVNKADPSMLTLEIKNEGDAHARLQGSAYVKTPEGDVVAETPLSAVVLNGGERTYNVKLEELDKLEKGQNYIIDFKMNNSFAPQNKFRAMNVDIDSLDYKLP